MNDVIRALSDRLARLEQTAVRYRAGEVTGTGPLDVALGGSDTSYEDVRSVGGAVLAVNDHVAVLVFNNDLIVLGAVDGARVAAGSGTLSFTAGNARSATLTVPHGLPATPVSATGTLAAGNGAGAGGPCNVTNVGASTFDVWATWNSVPGGNFTATVYWIAVG